MKSELGTFFKVVSSDPGCPCQKCDNGLAKFVITEEKSSSTFSSVFTRYHCIKCIQTELLNNGAYDDARFQLFLKQCTET